MRAGEPKITPEIGNKIFDILVKHAGAREDSLDRMMFLQYHDGPFQLREWRFMGKLGTGGKFYSGEGNYWRVSCYREDETPERLKIIEETNRLLADLFIAHQRDFPDERK